jgi:cytochrome c-type biogenesis protein CcmH
MVLFWLAAALLSAVAAGLILLRAARAGGVVGGGDPTVAVYRRALAEIDELAGHGLVAEDERGDARGEAGRRLLAAADRGAEPLRAELPRPFVLAAAAAAPIAALIVYALVGSPGAPDQPFSGRLAAWLQHPERYQAPELAAALRSLAQDHPDDPEPLRRLAQVDLAMGDADGAAHALRRALVIAPGRVELLAPLGEVLVLKAQGKVDADARAVFGEILRIDPKSPPARYWLGRAAIAEGQVEAGLSQWRGLLADLDTGDARRQMLAGEIEGVEKTGALPPDTPAGPAPAADVSRAIRGMVEGLAERLEAHPDDAQGWVRLVRAYTVLGETAKRDAALETARRRYAGQPRVMAELNDALAAPR